MYFICLRWGAHFFSSSATCATGSMTLFSSGFTSHGRTKPLPFFLNRSSKALAFLCTLSRSAYLPGGIDGTGCFWGKGESRDARVRGRSRVGFRVVATGGTAPGGEVGSRRVPGDVLPRVSSRNVVYGGLRRASCPYAPRVDRLLVTEKVHALRVLLLLDLVRLGDDRHGAHRGAGRPPREVPAGLGDEAHG